MLPRSVLSSNGRKSGISLALHGNGGVAQKTGQGVVGMRERLSARSRVTNLGIVLLLGVTVMSVLLNLRFLINSARGGARLPKEFGSWTSFHGLTPQMLKENLPAPPPGSTKLSHLVLVPGHAIWAGCSFAERENDEHWVLEPYQRGGSVKTYWKHIAKAVEIADADPTALLIFSGGQTRPTSLQTEAESYFALALSSSMALPVLPNANFSHLKGTKAITADAADILGHVGSGAQANAGVATGKGLDGVRMTTENFALDSFENLLFSVARFREYTGKYPQRITVVGYGMKKARFEDLHAKALRWPVKGYYNGLRKFLYVGIDDDGDTTAEYEGERIKAFRLFERDMYGCHGALQKKRKARNLTRRFHGYFTSAPELADILNWCPPDQVGLQGVYPDTLPWDLRITTDGWGRGAKQYREQHKSEMFPDARWLQLNADRV